MRLGGGGADDQTARDLAVGQAAADKGEDLAFAFGDAGELAWRLGLWPGPSRTFWLGGVFYNQNRIGDPANPSDQSLSGALARLAGTADPPRLWWLVTVLAVGLAGLAVAVWAHRRGYRMAGLGCCAVTGLLVSPMSWTHHWVWVVPLLVWLTTAAWRRRSAAWALAAAIAAAVFSDYTPLPWPGHPADPARMVASDLYVLFGLAGLAAVGVALTRTRRIRPGRNPGATGEP